MINSTCTKRPTHSPKTAYDRGECRCEVCKNAAYLYKRQWVKDNPTKRKDSVRRSLYGLEPEDYQFMLIAQNGLCAICKESPATHIDHRHSDGLVRGILCPACNRAIGIMLDQPTRLRSAANYLEKDDS